jgi:hypothetical protein
MADSSSQLGSDVEDSSSQLEPDTKDCSSEVRFMIWEEALPGPRIVYLEPITRPNFTYFPVRSDIAIDDYDEDGYCRFFDTEREIDIETAHKLRNEGDRVQGKTTTSRASELALRHQCFYTCVANRFRSHASTMNVYLGLSQPFQRCGSTLR